MSVDYSQISDWIQIGPNLHTEHCTLPQNNESTTHVPGVAQLLHSVVCEEFFVDEWNKRSLGVPLDEQPRQRRVIVDAVHYTAVSLIVRSTTDLMCRVRKLHTRVVTVYFIVYFRADVAASLCHVYRSDDEQHYQHHYLPAATTHNDYCWTRFAKPVCAVVN